MLPEARVAAKAEDQMEREMREMTAVLETARQERAGAATLHSQKGKEDG
jgi:hypothetical protein